MPAAEYDENINGTIPYERGRAPALRTSMSSGTAICRWECMLSGVCRNERIKLPFVGAMDMDWKDREKSQDQDS
jgi:hypothetical protein